MRYLTTNSKEIAEPQASDDMQEESFEDGMQDELMLNRGESIEMRAFDPDAQPPFELSLSRNASFQPISNRHRDFAHLDFFVRDNPNRPPSQQDFEDHQMNYNHNQLQTLSGNSRNSLLIAQKTEEFGDMLLPLTSSYSFLEERPLQEVKEDPPKKHQQPQEETRDKYPKYGNLQTFPAHFEIFSHNGEPGGFVPADVNPPKFSCTCTKSECLKLYCMCFREGVSCNDHCKCTNCLNTPANFATVSEYRHKKMVRKTDNPETFCNCRMSFCEKLYCPCYRQNKPCGKLCKCFHCKNSNRKK